MTYKEWMQKVDRAVQAQVGLSVHDLEDFCSRDLYEDGVSPEDAALDAIENDSTFSMFLDF